MSATPAGATTARPIPSPRVEAVLSGLLRDAVLLARRGTATPADIDTAMRTGAGHPSGPLEVLAALPAARRAELGPAVPDRSPPADATGRSATAWTGPVGVAGTGHMAGGIVEAVARNGREVRVLHRTPAAGDRLGARVRASLDRAVARGRLDGATRAGVLARIRITGDAAGLAGTDVVVEAVAEDLDVKAEVLRRLDAALPPTLPLATNTSSFRVADLRPFAGAGRPVLALHFFNPAQVMKLVEVVVPDDQERADDLRAAATGWARDLGKTPIRCGDARGFVVNRLLIPFLNDAVRLHESGMSVTEVDDLLRSGAGHPMGPLELIDLIGVDVTVAALETMAAVEDDPRIPPAGRLRTLLTEGRLGRKTGAGLHTYR